MSTLTGAIQAGKKIPDGQLLPDGERGSVPVFFLSATPPVNTVALAGHSNRDRVARAPKPVELESVILGSRRFAGARPSGQTVTFDVAIAGVGTVTPNWAGDVLLATDIAGVGTVSPSLVKPTTVLAASIAGTSTVTPTMSGGTISGQLDLTPEDSTGLTLTPGSSDSKTLTSESSDSLTLIPEE